MLWALSQEGNVKSTEPNTSISGNEGYIYPVFTEELGLFHPVYSIEGWRHFVYASFLNTGNAIDWD